MDTQSETGHDGYIHDPQLHQERLYQESVTELVREAGTEIERLFRSEMAVAKRELADSARSAVRSGIFIGAGAVLGLIGFMALTACGIAALALALPLWLSALLVGGFYVILAGVGFFLGREKLKQVEVPQLKHHLQEDQQWLKTTVERMKTSRANAHA
jgi:hypothetical protein